MSHERDTGISLFMRGFWDLALGRYSRTFEQKCADVDMCPKCGGELDTGWECNKCGFDAMPLVSLTPR